MASTDYALLALVAIVAVVAIIALLAPGGITGYVPRVKEIYEVTIYDVSGRLINNCFTEVFATDNPVLASDVFTTSAWDVNLVEDKKLRTARVTVDTAGTIYIYGKRTSLELMKDCLQPTLIP